MITDNPGVRRMQSAAPWAAAVAPSTAKPTLALRRAGASLTPSPVIPVMWPFFWKSATMSNLSSGKTSAKPSQSSMSLSKRASGSFSESGFMIESPIPRRRHVSLAMSWWSPVIILTEAPYRIAASTTILVSSRGGSNSDIMPIKCHLPPTISATATGRSPLPANISMASSTSWRISSALCDRFTITWGAPLVTRTTLPSGLSIVDSVRLITGSNGKKSSSLNASRRSWSFTDSRHTLSMASGSIALAASAALKIMSSQSKPANMYGVSMVRTFLVRVPVLSEQSVVIPASSSMADNFVTTACACAILRAPIAIVAVTTTGVAIGMAAIMSTTKFEMILRASLFSQPWISYCVFLHLLRVDGVVTSTITRRMFMNRAKQSRKRVMRFMMTSTWPLDSTDWISATPFPISVFSPMCVTTMSCSPRLTTVPE
mmetsp:Transcript_13414/g.34334  ORF Transcript_13414/g.34334 Transcript_13414/m.34334 type:complete len:430 (-) Transcript_13414:581-1870(-)